MNSNILRFLFSPSNCHQILCKISVMSYILECFEQKPFERVVLTEYHNTNVAEGNVEEEEKSEEDTGDRKDEKQTQ